MVSTGVYLITSPLRKVCISKHQGIRRSWHEAVDLREVDVATDLHQEDIIASPLEGITACHQGVRR